MNTLQKLEFDKIQKIVCSFCSTFQGKKLGEELLPSYDKKIVANLLAQTEEAITLMYRNTAPSFYGISDVALYLKSLDSQVSLSCKALLDLATIFKLAQELKDYFDKDFLAASDFPILSQLFASLYTNKMIVQRIFSAILDEETLDDSASKALHTIRRKQRNLEQEIRSKLNDMIHSSHYAKYIQESLVTIRNDRFVIPVKDEYRSQIKGFIHDVSNAGSTVFIEPISVFEMNNELNQLHIEEELEIERILQELSSLFYPYMNELQLDVTVIGQLDFIFAKAKYARSIKGNIPTINDTKELHLLHARHPLIDPSHVVPISVSLGSDFSTLLITGPNTGGKTVTLKTVGLLTCMACSGLAIPADETSSFYVFDSVFADIGDDQSISDSLSTFSSHMKNIVTIIEQASSDSLVLVDELGSGTDPLEGANLAISILEFLKEKEILTLATTHYQELKQYALVTDGFENASVEFDLATLSPTYRLLVGIPGKSNAFAISEKLGLSPAIITRAKSLLSTQEINIEELLKNIYDDKSLIEKEKIEIQKKSEEINALKQSLLSDNESLRLQEQTLLNDAKMKARNILLDAKEEATEIIQQMNQLSNTKELNHLRNELNTKIKDISLTQTTTSSAVSSLTAEEIVLTQEVFVTTLGQNGTIVSHVSKSNEVQVQVGSMKMSLPISVLEKVSKGKTEHSKQKKVSSNYTSISKTRTIRSEINVIGYTVEEAIFVVDKFLDDASLSKLQTVRIVHGKGTGKLKNGIHQFLKSNPHVKSYRMGVYGEGEMGVTVVTLK